MDKERNVIYDIAKGIGIILVIWGHTACPLFDEIYAFHMPLFFIISGVFFDKNKSSSQYILNVIKKIGYPFLLFSILIYLYYLIFSLIFHTKFNYCSILNIIPYKDLSSTPLWFLVSLFTVSICYYYLAKIKNVFVLFVVVSALFIFSKMNIIPNYFYVNTSLSFFIYYFIGNTLCKNYEDRFLKGIQYYQKISLFALGFILFIYLFHTNLGHQISPIFSSVLIVLAGSFMIINFSSLLLRLDYISTGLSYIGKNSLCIFALQLPLMEFTRPISSLIFEKGTYLWGGMNVVVNLGITIIVAEILYRIFPTILKKK